MILNEAVDDDGEELWRKTFMIAFGLGDNVDERGKIGRDDGVRCRTLSVGSALVVDRRLDFNSFDRKYGPQDQAPTAC